MAQLLITPWFITLFLIGSLSLPLNAMAGDIYKWTDEEGNVHYGAQPESSNAQNLNIKVTPPPTVTDHQNNAQDNTSAEFDETNPDSSTDDPSAISDKQAEIDAKNEEIRKKNCEMIKTRLAAIQRGGRLYEVDDKGERQYWDDKTRTSKLDKAQADLKKWCG